MYWETGWGCLVTSIQVASICEAINVHLVTGRHIASFKGLFGNKQAHCSYACCKVLRDNCVTSRLNPLRSIMILIQITLELHRIAF